MIYDYSKLKNIEAITTETGRVYKTPAGNFPSITTLLGKTANNTWLAAWKDRVGIIEANRISKKATDRGELVHSYLERYWNKEDISDLKYQSEDVQYMTNNLINKTKYSLTAIYAQEIAVYSPTLKYAGRLDVVGEWNGVPALIDYKTSKKEKRATDIKDYRIQASAYVYAHNELFKSNIKDFVILITTETGVVQEFCGKAVHFIPDLKYRINTFYKVFGEDYK